MMCAYYLFLTAFGVAFGVPLWSAALKSTSPGGGPVSFQFSPLVISFAHSKIFSGVRLYSCILSWMFSWHKIARKFLPGVEIDSIASLLRFVTLILLYFPLDVGGKSKILAAWASLICPLVRSATRCLTRSNSAGSWLQTCLTFRSLIIRSYTCFP